MAAGKERNMENLTNTMYDFVEKTLKNETPSPQALAIVPSVLDKLEKYIIQREDAKAKV